MPLPGVDPPAMHDGEVPDVLADERAALGRRDLEQLIVDERAKLTAVRDGGDIEAFATEPFSDLRIVLLVQEQPQPRAASR